jgi:hypothetical protein
MNSVTINDTQQGLNTYTPSVDFMTVLVSSLNIKEISSPEDFTMLFKKIGSLKPAVLRKDTLLVMNTSQPLARLSQKNEKH